MSNDNSFVQYSGARGVLLKGMLKYPNTTDGVHKHSQLFTYIIEMSAAHVNVQGYTLNGIELVSLGNIF